MARLDYEVEVQMRVVHLKWSAIVMTICIAAVLITGMHYGYECGCP